MNRSYNNNYEIVNHDGGCYQPRYPLANALGSEWQNMNYKDWMNRCISGETGEVFGDTSDSVRNGLIIGTGIAWALLGLIPIIGGPASAIAGLFNVLLPYWWPEQAGDPGTPEAQFTWEQLMTAVEDITSEKILESRRLDAIARWQGIQLLGRDYYVALCDWINDQNNEVKKAKLRDTFDDVEDYLKISMPFFHAQGYEVPMLSMYGQAANMHLLLLRDVVQNGVRWGFQQYEVDRYYSNTSSQGNPGLLQLLARYTDYCVSWYNTGLQRQYDTGDWNKFNDFRRDMTIMVLDTVAAWPTFNPKFYGLTKSQLTRTVYTPLTEMYLGSIPIDVLERNALDIPRLFVWLREIKFYLLTTAPGQAAGWPGVSGVQQTFQNTLSNNLWQGGLKGKTTGLIDTLTISPPETGDDVWMIQQYWNTLPQAYNFTQSSTQLIHTDSSLPNLGLMFGLPCKGSNLGPCDPCDSNNLCRNEISNTNVPCNDKTLYSHRFSYYGAGDVWTHSGILPNLDFNTFGWTHISADPNNLIDAEKITQIPAVKGYQLLAKAVVIKGPGSTGGDLVKLADGFGILRVKVTTLQSDVAGYLIRLRYASDEDTVLRVDYQGAQSFSSSFNLPATYSGGNLTYNTFKYQDTLFIESHPNGEVGNIELVLNQASGNLILDQIEFLPVTWDQETYQAKQALEKARKAVNALFTNDTKNALKLHVTDYLVDQAAKLVECMSDEIYPQEKICLLDLVKVAKRLSQTRNLLNHGDFESTDWSGENGWKTSNHVSVTSGNPIFKGRYLHMLGANNPQFSDTVFPTYAYQKIDESKLKPYTRYMVRGFVGNSKDLEVFITRYDKEVHKNMNVPHVITPTNPCTGAYQLGEGPMLTNHTIPQDMLCDTCGAGTLMKVQQTVVKCEDPHAFAFHIDTGELDMKCNLGIWVGFKIGTTDGRATVDNLEVIEANPLTGEALARVKKREHKWKQKWMEKRTKIETTVQTARGAIQALFTDSNQNRLKPDITLNHILQAETGVQKIPYVYNAFLQGALPSVPGETYDIFQQLSSAVEIARSLYEQRNVLRNGDFMAGLSNWKGAKDAIVQKIGNTSVLVISDWIANLSQDVCVNPEHGYILRVTAKKEESGEGYVKIRDGTDDNTETLKFTVGEEMTRLGQSNMRSRIQEQNIVNTSEEAYGADGYASNPMTGYPSNNYEMNAYPCSTNMTTPNGGCNCSCGCGANAYAGENGAGYGCGCRTYINNRTESYASPMTAQNSSSLSGYVTKTVEIFPETNRVCVEIGETSGTFKVESIELIRMDCE